MKEYLLLIIQVLFLLFFVNGCYWSVSKPIVQEINILNNTGSSIEVAAKPQDSVLVLKDGQSGMFDISNTNYVDITLGSSSRILNRYDLTDIDIKATADKSSTGVRISGRIHWVYVCSLNNDRTLVFKRITTEDKIVNVVITPMEHLKEIP